MKRKLISSGFVFFLFFVEGLEELSDRSHIYGQFVLQSGIGITEYLKLFHKYLFWKHAYISLTSWPCWKSEGLHWMKIKELFNAYYDVQILLG